ncbi:kinesin-like protein KIN-14L [Coffea eugenioides]|uniref:kinesin-like protein KIN-14L n=1 Tax=Coffea eugenioides TaxID=49369 RepID=UPI000F6077FE|nr:kinesin-like protein KIN-14L [Coffea eugenioides]
MEDPRKGGGGRHDLNLASRKAEEAALRRFQATHWLECLMGPLGISSQPSEKEFIACLRNGLILCNLINKIQPGSVPKVVEKHSSLHSLFWDSQPLPAYQYFENVRNFLVAVEELHLPAFEASVFERDNIEEGSSTKVVDCILALKAYQEWKQMNGSDGFNKPPRSPFMIHSSCRPNTRPQGSSNSNSCRQLDMSTSHDKKPPAASENQKVQDLIIKALADHMVDTKENMDSNLVASFHKDPVKQFGEILSTCLEEQLHKRFPEMMVLLSYYHVIVVIKLTIELSVYHVQLRTEIVIHNQGRSSSKKSRTCTPLEDLSSLVNQQCCRACLTKGFCNHWNLVEKQEKELMNLKILLSTTKKEFEGLQTQLNSDLKQLGGQLLEMSVAAQKYHRVVKENRNLYNMVEDLKGNIRVYCRIRPLFRAEKKSVIDFIGEDGSLVVVDPLKPQKDGRKIFQFNRVFGPAATQGEVFADTRPLIRSVMDGYNVCIFAYGQTGSGKTHTMSGPSGGTTEELGINYLALNDLFQLSAKRKDIMKYDMHVQMVEIYNEQVRDLLAEDSSVTKLEIRSCLGDNDLALPDASKHHVTSTADVITLMKFGETNRAVGSTAINNRSSRSHSVLTIHVNGEDVSGSRLYSCLHLVDLAGSERVDKSEVTGEGLKEAQHINKSLSSLGDVIMALAQKNSHIPYRNSKLTLLLQNALGGHAKTLMFAHVSPEGDSFGETISTLKFAQRVSTVELGAACANKESSEVLELKAQIESLKKALAKKETYTPQRSKTKEAVKTPLAERTPPRPRRLSIENCSSIKLEKENSDDRKGTKTPFMQGRSRRLSLEGQRYAKKDPEQITFIDPLSKPLELNGADFQNPTPLQNGAIVKKPLGNTGIGRSVQDIDRPSVHKSPTKSPIRSSMVKMDLQIGGLVKTDTSTDLQEPAQLQDTEVLRKSEGHAGNGCSVMDINRPIVPKTPTKSAFRSPMVRTDTGIGSSVAEINSLNIPKSPTKSGLRTPMVKTSNRTRIPQLQQPKTPQPAAVTSRNESQKGIKSEHSVPSELITPGLTNTAHGKGSQIRKSLRSIGKLINGSEKRNQQKSIEPLAVSPFNGSSNTFEEKSPISSNSRALRRQSLTGIPPPDRSRRSSLGGNPSTDSYEKRNSKTPPPVRASTKLTKRWL